MGKSEIKQQIKELEDELRKLYALEKYGYLTDTVQRIMNINHQIDLLRFEYPYADGPTYQGEEIDLYLNEEEQESSELEGKYYTITLHGTTKRIGRLRLSLELDKIIPFYANIGYSILPKYRGNHYALKTLELVRQDLLEKGFSQIKITAYPDNIASIKTIEAFGGQRVKPEEGESWNTYEVDLTQHKK